jgi:hypothetical protein
VLEAFKRCAAFILARVEAAARAAEGPTEALATGIGALATALAGDPAVARLVAIEIRAGNGACRKAHEAWLARLETLVQSKLPSLNGLESRWRASPSAGLRRSWRRKLPPNVSRPAPP